MFFNDQLSPVLISNVVGCTHNNFTPAVYMYLCQCNSVFFTVTYTYLVSFFFFFSFFLPPVTLMTVVLYRRMNETCSRCACGSVSHLPEVGILRAST